MTHPTDRDLINFAREELGPRRQDKILAHCRQCPPCAERLIETTREQAPDPGPIKLSRWNKLSILLLILALVAAIGGMMWVLNQLGSQPDLHGAPELYETPAPDPLEQEQSNR